MGFVIGLIAKMLVLLITKKKPQYEISISIQTINIYKD